MTSNIPVDFLDVHHHALSTVAIVIADGQAGVEGILHAFTAEDALLHFVEKQQQQHPEVVYNCLRDNLATALNYVVWNDFEGFSLHPSIDTHFDVARNDLEPLVDWLDSFSTMHNLRRGRIETKDAAKRLRNKTIYYAATQSTRVYLTYKSAREHSGSTSIRSARLTDVAKTLAPKDKIEIEPKEEFAVEIEVQELE